jgi:hypothetical protein
MDTTQRPASSRPLSPSAGDATLGSVIAGLLAENGADRELRAALWHIDAELGTMPVRDIRPRHVTALLDDLRRAGLSARRGEAVEAALHVLFAFAVARRLVAVNPMTGPAPAPPAPSTPTPTFAMIALGRRVAVWTTWMVVIGFLALLLLVLVALG